MTHKYLGWLMGAALVLGGTACASPDLTGPWQIAPGQGRLRPIDGGAPPLLPAAMAKYRANQAALAKDAHVDPVANCLPPGVPRLMMQRFPFNVVQGMRNIAFVFEWNHLTRVVYMDRDHFEAIGPLYLGQPVGRWQGNVLEIDTNNFNDTTWLDNTGLPHSDQLHTIEKIRLIDGGRGLEDRITIDDPASFSRKWDAVLRFAKKPGVIVNEDYCLGRR